MKAKHYISFGLFILFLSMLPFTKGVADDLQPPQVAIKAAPDQLP